MTIILACILLVHTVDTDAIKEYYWCNYILQVGQLTCARWCGSRNNIIFLSWRSCSCAGSTCRLYILLPFAIPHHAGYKVKMPKFSLYVLCCFDTVRVCFKVSTIGSSYVQPLLFNFLYRFPTAIVFCNFLPSFLSFIGMLACLLACTCTCQKTSLVLSIALCPYTHARRIRLLLRRGRGGVFCVRASTKGWVLGTTRDPRYFKSWSEGTVWSVRALKTLSPPGIEPGAGELVASMLTTAPIDWLLTPGGFYPGLFTASSSGSSGSSDRGRASLSL